MLFSNQSTPIRGFPSRRSSSYGGQAPRQAEFILSVVEGPGTAIKRNPKYFKLHNHENA